MADALRGATLFRKINVPVLGLVENMSYHLCPECGHRSHIFGQDGGRRLAEAQHLELLGQVRCSQWPLLPRGHALQVKVGRELQCFCLQAERFHEREACSIA